MLVFTAAIQLWELYILAFLFGTIDAVFYPASTSIIPSLVPEDQLQAANGLSQGSSQITMLIGPAAAGVLIAVANRHTGTGIAFAFDAISFLLSALALRLMQRSDRTVALETSENLLASIGAGIRYVWQDPAIRSLLLATAALNFSVNGAFNVGLPALAHARFGTAASLGIMLSGFGAGALLGTVTGGSIKRPHRRGVIMIVTMTGFGAGILLIALIDNFLLGARCWQV